MRIQPGFIRCEIQNPYADLIDANILLASAVQSGEIARLSQKIKNLSQQYPQEFNEKKAMWGMAFRTIVAYYKMP